LAQTVSRIACLTRNRPDDAKLHIPRTKFHASTAGFFMVACRSDV
jgi:hypothetical protein